MRGIRQAVLATSTDATKSVCVNCGNRIVSFPARPDQWYHDGDITCETGPLPPKKP